jgi:orotate phosphoribosyltransferase
MDWVLAEKFNDFIIHNNIVGFFEKPLKLKSGRTSYWYVNWRNVSQDAYLIDKLTDFLLSFVAYLNLDLNCFYGVPEGATKLGIITQLKWAKLRDDFLPNNYVLPMGRGKPKEHGDPKDKFFLGMPRGKVVILEDTATTGESLVKCIKNFDQIDIDVIAAIVLTDRNEYRDDRRTVEEVITELGIEYYAMSNAIEILPKLNPDNNIAKKIEEYFKIYGTEPIHFHY